MVTFLIVYLNDNAKRLSNELFTKLSTVFTVILEIRLRLNSTIHALTEFLQHHWELF